MATPTFQYFRDSSNQLWSISVNPDGSLTTTEVTSGTPSPGGGTPIGDLVAGDILCAVKRDAQLLTTNNVALLDYLDRICQRILRETQWIFLKSQPQQFTTTPGQEIYYIGTGPVPDNATDTGLLLGDVQSILTQEVFDLTNKRQLMPDSPKTIATGELYPPPKTFSYDNTWNGVFCVYPVTTDSKPALISFRYMKQRAPITLTTDILQIPDNYRDVVIAGVNWFATAYMDHDAGYSKTAMWKSEFMDGLRQMRKDLNLNFRQTDMVFPDPTTQISGTDSRIGQLF